MRTTFITKQFKKDYKKSAKSGRNIQALDILMLQLIQEEVLEASYQDHALGGEWKNSRDCHIQGDFVLIYTLDSKNGIYFERVGSHSELFG